MSTPSEDDQCDLLMACRYGDLDDVQQFVSRFGQDAVALVRDDNGNTALHMTAGNGHGDVLDYLLPIVPPSFLSTQNNAGSTPLHWAALNAHLNIVQKLIRFPRGPGVDLIDIKNAAGRSPLAEAETAGWDEGAKWLIEMMRLDPHQGEQDVADVDEEEDDGGVHSSNVAQGIEVEIEDGTGQVAKMSVLGDADAPSRQKDGSQ